MTPGRGEFRFTNSDGLQIACSRWLGTGDSRVVVRIAHGMGEHGRYPGLIEILVPAGFAVYANDHRGHRRTASSADKFGDFGEGRFDLLVADMVRLTRMAREENHGVPIIIFGYSMGSFASQQHVLDHSREIHGLVLSGSGALDGLAPRPGVGARRHRHLERSLRTGAYPIRLAQSRQRGGRRIYGAAGLRNIQRDSYPGGRHEVLNDTNRDEVRSRLLRWMNNTRQICASTEPLPALRA